MHQKYPKMVMQPWQSMIQASKHVDLTINNEDSAIKNGDLTNKKW